jgi:hypothetical protein
MTLTLLWIELNACLHEAAGHLRVVDSELRTAAGQLALSANIVNELFS